MGSRLFKMYFFISPELNVDIVSINRTFYFFEQKLIKKVNVNLYIVQKYSRYKCILLNKLPAFINLTIGYIL